MLILAAKTGSSSGDSAMDKALMLRPYAYPTHQQFLRVAERGDAVPASSHALTFYSVGGVDVYIRRPCICKVYSPALLLP